jgi:hypothetical protein
MHHLNRYCLMMVSTPKILVVHKKKVTMTHVEFKVYPYNAKCIRFNDLECARYRFADTDFLVLRPRDHDEIKIWHPPHPPERAAHQIFGAFSIKPLTDSQQQHLGCRPPTITHVDTSIGTIMVYFTADYKDGGASKFFFAVKLNPSEALSEALEGYKKSNLSGKEAMDFVKARAPDLLARVRKLCLPIWKVQVPKDNPSPKQLHKDLTFKNETPVTTAGDVLRYNQINGPVDGSITQGSINKLFERANLNETSTLLDIGCSGGRVLLHARHRFRCKLALGVELAGERLLQLIDSAKQHKIDQLYPLHLPLEHFQYLDPVTHVFFYSEGINGDCIERIDHAVWHSESVKYFITSNKHSHYWMEDGGKFKMIYKFPCRMYCSDRTKMMYVWRRNEDINEETMEFKWDNVRRAHPAFHLPLWMTQMPSKNNMILCGLISS